MSKESLYYGSQEMVVRFGDWKAGNAVIHNSRRGHVVAVKPGQTSADSDNMHVPIMYDDEANCFVNVLSSELFRS